MKQLIIGKFWQIIKLELKYLYVSLETNNILRRRTMKLNLRRGLEFIPIDLGVKGSSHKVMTY